MTSRSRICSRAPSRAGQPLPDGRGSVTVAFRQRELPSRDREGAVTRPMPPRHPTAAAVLFSLLPALLPAATVSGRVVLADSREAAVRRNGNYAGVVVWLEPVRRAPLPPPSPPAHVTMLQKDKRFTPHVLAVQVGA